MKADKPRFALARVFEDGSREWPELVPVTAMPWDTQMGRRGFLGAGITVPTALLVLGSGQASGQTGPDTAARAPVDALRAEHPRSAGERSDPDMGLPVRGSQNQAHRPDSAGRRCSIRCRQRRQAYLRRGRRWHRLRDDPGALRAPPGKRRAAPNPAAASGEYPAAARCTAPTDRRTAGTDRLPEGTGKQE